MTDRVAFARVSAEAISVEECVAAVENDAAGAVVTFAGVVRDHDGGRGVLSLDYESHPTAGEVIATAAALVADEFPSVTIAVEHRVGSLGVGDLALACAVSSAHRAEAFAACARLVDVVKETVPIWKEQRFTDGTTEWVASLGGPVPSPQRVVSNPVAHLLGAEALHLEYPTRVVFDSVTIGVDEGQRIGIVGRNGDGKSTLLRLLSGRIEPDDGRVTRRRGITLGMLDQADELDDDLVVSHAIVGDRPEHEWAGDPRVRDVLEGLVGGIPWEARLGELSGGQRRRVALAALLVVDWDVVFLDEPTNHLDVEGIAWLAQHLKRRWSANAGGLLVVTHDRWFLDEVCTDTWEVHDRIIEPFEGGYAAYILQRVERDRMAAASESKRQNLMRKELAWLRRGAPARSTKPKFRMDAAYELIENEPPPRDSVSLASMAMQRLGKDVVDIVDVSVSYDETPVLKDVTWLIAPGERTGILGVNGAGKSTLLGLVSGTVTPTTGKVKRGKTIKVAMLTQQLAELEDIWEDRVSDVLKRQKSSYISGGKEMTPTQLLERVGFQSAQLSTRVRELSGGQKRRLQLLLIILDEPNVLILDEPTNDLDTDMLAAIEDLLDSYPGTLLVVSHDRYLIERVTDQQYAVLDGHFRHLPGGVEQYLALRLSSLAEPVEAKSPAPIRGSGLKGAELRNSQKEFAAAERKIAKLTGQINDLHVKLAEHDQSDYAGLGTLTTELQGYQTSLSEVESRWLELSELLG